LASSKNYEYPHYAVFSTFSALCSRHPEFLCSSIMVREQVHTQVKQQGILQDLEILIGDRKI
jgi:hypothetical protein